MIPPTDPTPPAADPQPKPTPISTRRWRLSVRSLMVLVLLVGVPIGWEAHRASRMRAAVAVLRRNPGDPPGFVPPPGQTFTIGGAPDRAEVEYDDERWDGEYLDPPRPAWLHGWLRWAVGDDHFRRVSTLKLSRRPTPADWEALRSFGALQELDLGYLDLAGDDLAGLAGCSTLRELSLIGSRATDRALARVGALASLRVLDLRMTAVTDAGLAHLRGLARLEELRLGDAAGTDAGLAHLAGLTNLRVLDAKGSDAAVSDAGLAHLRGLARLEELQVAAHGVTDAGVAVLAGLPRLKALDLDSSFRHLREAFALTPAGVEQLGRFPRLEELKLDALVAADDAWLRAIGRVGTLRKLQVSGQRITDAGLAALGPLARLEELRISSPRVTDAGLAHLAPLANLADLSFYSGVTPEGADRFRATRPRLKPVRVDLWVEDEPQPGPDGLPEAPRPPAPPMPVFGPARLAPAPRAPARIAPGPPAGAVPPP